MKIGLIVIDGQKDFCEGGNLGVTGGHDAMCRVANMIDRIGKNLSGIDLTIDAHHQHHIAHSIMWVDKNGKHPAPFTQIKEGDIIGSDAIYRATNPAFQTYQEEYIKNLAIRNTERENLGLLRIEHNIWPDHCLIGTDGMSIHNEIIRAIHSWECSKMRPAQKTTKGSYIFAEHFSVLKAEVQDNNVPETKVNMRLIDKLAKYDQLAWCGLAKDYCLMNSFIDFIIELSNGDKTIQNEIAKKMVFIEDGTASVGAVPALEQKFEELLTSWNVKKETTDSFLA